MVKKEEVVVETEEVKHPTLNVKLFNIQKQLCETGVAKTQGGQYATRQIDTLIGCMSEVFTQNRVVLRPEIMDVDRSIVTLASGKNQNSTIVKIKYHFIDADSDETSSTIFFGEASDSLDKSLQQAITNAYKYLMIQHFQIPVEPRQSDPDMVQSEADHEATGEGLAQAVVQTLTVEDLVSLRALVVKTNTDEAQFCKFLKVDSLENLPLSKASSAIEALRQKERSQNVSRQNGKVDTPQAKAVLEAMNKGREKADE